MRIEVRIVLVVRTARSLEEAGAAEWDAAAGPGGFYLSHEWLRLVAADPSATAEYLLGYDGDRLIAVLPLYDVHTENLGLYRPSGLADNRWQGRYLLAGSRRGFINGFLVDPGLPAERRTEAFRALLPVVKDRAGASGADGALFLHLTTEAAAEMYQAGEGGFTGLPLLTLVDATIEVPGDGLDDYVRSIPSHARRKVRREMKVFGEAGYEVTQERLTDCLAEAKSLVCNLQHRYGHVEDDEKWRSELDHMARLLGRRDVVFSARRDGALVGFALGYPFSGTLYMRRCGFDYDALQDAFEYFNLAYYLPLQYAYRHGLRRLHLGPTAYEAKVRRGAVLTPLWSLAVSAGAAAGRADPDPACDHAADLAWNRKAVDEWFGRYGAGSAVLTGPGWTMWGGAADDRAGQRSS
jgi:uncharacterized protein